MSVMKVRPLLNRLNISVPKTGRAWVELDHEALRHNVEALSSQLPAGSFLMPAVKANAYGHGAVLISRELSRMGIHSFCVATAEEGVELRRSGITGLILILGYTPPEHLPLLIRWELTQTVVDYDYAVLLNSSGGQYSVHIGVDTGMHRLGEPSANIKGICQMFAMENLTIDGIFSHLCVADSEKPEDVEFTNAQGKAFYSLTAKLEKRGLRCPKKHILNSVGLLNYQEFAGDYVRVGIALYGVLSTRLETKNCKIELRPVLSLKSRVASIKKLNSGEGAGYGLSFVAKQETKIAVLTIGYADGLPRSLSCGVGNVLINGFKVPIVGRICMDQTLIDVSAVPEIKAGDTAIIIGVSGKEMITACDIAEQTGTITNEIFSRLGGRLERTML